MKKLFYGIVLTGVVFGQIISSTNALENVSDKCYDYYSQEQINYILEQSNPNDLDLSCKTGTLFSQEKLDNDKNLNKDLPRPYYFTKELHVTPYKQEKYYGCGYASTKEVLQYINGTSKSQSAYEQEMGNNGNSAVVWQLTNLLNKYISAPKYSYTEGKQYTLDTFKKLVEDNIAIQRPIVMHAKVNTLPLYKKSATDVWHYYVIDGYTYSMYGIADNIYYVDSYSHNYGDGDTFGSHLATAKEVFDSVYINGRFVIHA